MEKSIVKFISIGIMDSNEVKAQKVNELIESMPNGYKIAEVQRIPYTESEINLMLVFNQIPNTPVNGLIQPQINTSQLGTFGGTGNVPTQKQLSYLAKLVDAIQPEDFPGLDEIKTKKLAGQWIAKLTKIQKENRGA